MISLLFSLKCQFISSKCDSKTRLIFKILIFIGCLKFTSSNFNPLFQECSNYLTGDLVSASVSTFNQIWITNEKLTSLSKNPLTFITYLDTLLKRDGSPIIDEEIVDFKCSNFSKYSLACEYAGMKDSILKLNVFDGTYLYNFLQHKKNKAWRILVVNAETYEISYFDTVQNCDKKRKNNLPFYKIFHCIIKNHFNLNDIKSLLMMNYERNGNSDDSSFEVWIFLKNRSMKKILFIDRKGNYQLISLALNSYEGIALASIQFLPDEIFTFNISYYNSFFHQKQKRYINYNENDNYLNYSHINSLENKVSTYRKFSSFKNQVTDHLKDNKSQKFFHYRRVKKDNYMNNFLYENELKKPSTNRLKKHLKKYRKKSRKKKQKNNRNYFFKIQKSYERKNGKSKKAVDFRLRRLLMGLSSYLNSFNLTLDSVIDKLKTIKTKAINMFMFNKQNHVIIFHKYFATFHNVHENFFIDSIRLPFVQPNQVFFGCPQPFCFLTTIDDLTYNQLTDELYIFRNQYYWKIKIGSQQTNKETPYIRLKFPSVIDARLISDEKNSMNINRYKSDFPLEFPTYIDAATYINYENFNYLIVMKDGWVFFYIPDNKKLVPFLFADYFQISMTNLRVDTIFFYKKQLFVFTKDHFWLYELLTDLKLKLKTKGSIFRNLPNQLDASFVYRGLFYFFKQNFFYLNDELGNSIIYPKLVHDSFLYGCNLKYHPPELKMSELFEAPPLINYYCVQCDGHLIANYRDSWNNNKTFVTVIPNEDLSNRDDLNNLLKVEIESAEPTKQTITKIINRPFGINKASLAHMLDIINVSNNIDIYQNNEVKMTSNPNVLIITNQSKKLENAMIKVDEFAFNTYSFIIHHLFVGFILFVFFLLIIHVCQWVKHEFSLSKKNESQIRRAGKNRRKEMISRNRRWN